MKKIFGGLNLTWKKLIIFAIILGIYPGIIAMIPAAVDTSFTDITVTFEAWILFGIVIIMNSKSALDSALKCFVFFLISQPLIYLTQDLFQHSSLFITYYRNWVLWTVACFPMGFIGYYMKKDKLWGLLILTPILFFLGYHYSTYLSETIFSFPRHFLTTIFCLATLIIYPLYIFKNKTVRIVGIVISSIIIIVMTILSLSKPNVYSTDILSTNDEYQFDDSYKVYLIDKKYGDLSIKYESGVESWFVHAEFKRAGKTEFVLESPSGETKKFEINISRSSYEVKEK